MNRLLVTIIITAICGFGAIAGSASAQVDGTPPTITITSPTEGQHYALNSAISASFSCDDPGGSGVASCASTGPPSTSSPGPHTYTVNATDVAGNAASKTVNYVVDADATAPTITITSPVDGQHYPLGTTINGTFDCADAGGSGIATCVASTPIAGTVGTHTFTVTATDGAGNPATKSVTYHVDPAPDTTAPVITITAPTEGQHYAFGATINASYSCDDPLSGIATCTATPIDNAVGTHTFTVSATDNAGNPATKSVTYTVDPAPTDTTDPVITITSPVDGQHYAFGSTINATYTCDDPGSGIASCTATAVSNAVGTHTFTVSAADNAGNPATKSVTYTVDPAPDTTPPTIAITSPVDGQHYASDTALVGTFTCDDAGSGIASCAAANGLDLSIGSHVFTVNATDDAGNTATKSATYIIDPPAAGGGGAPGGGGGGTPGGATGGTQNGTPTVGVPGSTALASTPRVTIPTRASRAGLARGVSLSLSRLKARSRVVLQIRRGPRTIKTMRATANAAGTVRFRIRLSSAQLRTLRGKTLTLRFSTTAANGKKKVVTKKLKVI